MKIAAVIPNDGWRQTAGVRIRYDRLAPALAALGHRLELVPIDTFRSDRDFRADVYLFSKTYDARAPLLARMMRDRGRRVGVDFFDDYFSQADDSRFVRLRRWLRSLVPALDFALCATPQMQERLADLAPGLACHVVNDPAGGIDRAAIAATADRNAASARETRHIDIAWFGIGDNPHFRVGLADLHAFGPMLADIRDRGYSIGLRVLTNERALTVERLEMLARLPVQVRLEHWSEAAERALIAESLVCFLPVNAQSFSTVKSLNRGVTTLSGGSQILSAGFPLYTRLGDFVYRDLRDLVDDLEKDRLKLRADTAGQLVDLLAQAGNARDEAAALGAFLAALPAPADRPAGTGPIMVVHGISTVAEVHNAVQNLGHLSVASPQAKARPGYDVALGSGQDGKPVAILSDRARHLLRPGLETHLSPATGQDEQHRFELSLDGLLPAGTLPASLRAGPSPLRIVEIAHYPTGMAQIQAVLERLFDRPEILISEQAVPYMAPPALERLPSPETADT